jgi:hypothetical protein
MKQKFPLGTPLTLKKNGCEYIFTAVADENDPNAVAYVQVTRRWLADPPDSPLDDMGRWLTKNAQSLWNDLKSGGYRPN